MRVTYIVPNVNLETGGGSHYTLQLVATELARLGSEILLVSLGPVSGGTVGRASYRVEQVDAPRGLDRMQRMKAAAGTLHRYAGQTDILHINGPTLAMAGAIYRRTGGTTPTVVTLNSYTLWCTNMDRMDGQCHQRCGVRQRILHSQRGPLRKLLVAPSRLYEQWFGFAWLNGVDHFLPDSPATQRIYAQTGFDMTNSTVIPEVIDFEALRGVARDARERSRGTRSDPWQILFAGRLIASKGVDLLIDALPLLRQPTVLHIAGDGPERQELLTRMRRLGLDGQVIFHGWVPNRQLWSLLREMDLFVHPGRWPEPCGRTIQEALALGVPTIVSDIGGPPWLIGDLGKTFRPNDPVDLAAKITATCERYDQALADARRGIERAAEFDYRRIVPRLIDVYDRLVTAPTSHLT